LEHLGYWLMAARYLVPKTFDCSISKLIISGSQKWGRNMDALFDPLQRASTVELSDEHVTPWVKATYMTWRSMKWPPSLSQTTQYFCWSFAKQAWYGQT